MMWRRWVGLVVGALLGYAAGAGAAFAVAGGAGVVALLVLAWFVPTTGPVRG